MVKKKGLNQEAKEVGHFKMVGVVTGDKYDRDVEPSEEVP